MSLDLSYGEVFDGQNRALNLLSATKWFRREDGHCATNIVINVRSRKFLSAYIDNGFAARREMSYRDLACA